MKEVYQSDLSKSNLVTKTREECKKGHWLDISLYAGNGTTAPFFEISTLCSLKGNFRSQTLASPPFIEYGNPFACAMSILTPFFYCLNGLKELLRRLL